MVRMNEKSKEGWGSILDSRKDHYFRNSRSLCGKWFCTSKELDQNDKKCVNDCAACRRKRDKELAKEMTKKK